METTQIAHVKLEPQWQKDPSLVTIDIDSWYIETYTNKTYT
jgi:hypothetical protein